MDNSAARKPLRQGSDGLSEEEIVGQCRRIEAKLLLENLLRKHELQDTEMESRAASDNSIKLAIM